MRIKSLLKYPGGKFKLLDQIEELMPTSPTTFQRYVDPFLGGGSSGLNLCLDAEIRYLCDVNVDITDFFKVIQGYPDLFINHVYELAEHRGPDAYNEARVEFNNTHTSFLNIRKAALLYYLNREGFNGLVRYNKKGEFNVPYGKYEKFTYPTHDHIKAVSERLKTSLVIPWGYDRMLPYVSKSLPPDNTFIYLDPPYIPISQTSNFTSYSKAFTIDDHRKMRVMLDELTTKGFKWMMSNSYCTETERVYEGYNFHEVSAARNISCNGEKRGKVSEYIITNYRRAA